MAHRRGDGWSSIMGGLLPEETGHSQAGSTNIACMYCVGVWMGCAWQECVSLADTILVSCRCDGAGSSTEAWRQVQGEAGGQDRDRAGEAHHRLL